MVLFGWWWMSELGIRLWMRMRVGMLTHFRVLPWGMLAEVF